MPLLVTGIAPRAGSDSPCLRILTVVPGLLGGLAARAGGAGVIVGALRVTFWGALAMAVTASVGALFGA